jgi:hypothetical protein
MTPIVNWIVVHFSVLVSLAALIVSFFALGWQWYAVQSERKRCLVIVQRQPEFLNVVEQWNDELTEFKFFVTIINNSLRTPVVIRRYELELPWKDDQFRWLEDPAEVGKPEDGYQYPDKSQIFPRKSVLNHRIYGEGRLAPGDVAEGYLLGLGYESIPVDFRKGATITMKFSVFDQNLKPHSIDCRFKVLKMP